MLNVLRSCDHENIARLHEVYENNKSFFLIFEFVQGRSLRSLLEEPGFVKGYPENKKIALYHSFLSALSYLASKGIMHRNLSPANVLIDEITCKVKIIGFDLATNNLSKHSFKKCGPPGYIAPEIFWYNSTIKTTVYNDRCDVFSAGCILFEM